MTLPPTPPEASPRPGPSHGVPPRLVPQAGPAAWTGSALTPADWMLPVGAEVAAELAGGGPDAAAAPLLAALMRQVAERLEHGLGFCLLRGLNLDRLADPDRRCSPSAACSARRCRRMAPARWSGASPGPAPAPRRPPASTPIRPMPPPCCACSSRARAAR
ncbi:hypothetical protein ACFQY5_01920 [Paeniroseomonas aquatica]|uniref:hypothetical protein n=1 Tax=Paeniroseomonas aquatica TaxID=373043 RepID=UPI0036132121